MGERGDGTGLALEARERIRRLGNGRGQHLDRNLTVQARVARTEDLSHAAGAQRRDDLVRAETLPDAQARHEDAGTEGPAPQSGGGCCSKALMLPPPMAEGRAEALPHM